jgi:G-patch domain
LFTFVIFFTKESQVSYGVRIFFFLLAERMGKATRAQMAKDPNNLHWVNGARETGVARRLMEKMGWQDGKGLGADQQGVTQQVGVTRRVAGDARGIGLSRIDAKAVDETDDGRGWREHGEGFGALLRRLGESSQVRPVDDSSDSDSDSSSSSSSSSNCSDEEEPEQRASKKRLQPASPDKRKRKRAKTEKTTDKKGHSSAPSRTSKTSKTSKKSKKGKKSKGKGKAKAESSDAGSSSSSSASSVSSVSSCSSLSSCSSSSEWSSGEASGASKNASKNRHSAKGKPVPRHLRAYRRRHAHRNARNYSAKDMAAILGKHPASVVQVTEDPAAGDDADDAGDAAKAVSSSSDEASAAGGDTPGDELQTLVTRKTAVTDYFAEKMTAMGFA